MLFPHFGLQRDQDANGYEYGPTLSEKHEPVKRLMEVLEKSGLKNITSDQTQILLRELYDKTFEIFDHDAPGGTRPLSVVALHPKERLGNLTSEYRTYQRFAMLEIGKLFNLSLDEFLEFPRHKTEWMFEIAESRIKVEDAENARMSKAMDDAAKSRGAAT